MTGPIEGTGFEVLDKEFKSLFAAHIHVERLWTGARWSEGPAWFAAGRYLVWSDIPNNRMMRWDETDGSVSVFRFPSNNSNGNTVDRQGRLVTCEHLTRRVTRTEHDGSITVLADSYDGKRLNSPNDVVVSSDGSIWFTDPFYGIMTDYEGDLSPMEQDGCHVYRIDPGGTIDRVADDFVQPNGLAFSPTRAFSTSPIPGEPTTRTALPISGSSRSARTDGSPAAPCSRRAQAAFTTASVSIATDGSGPASPRACTA